MRFNKFFFRSLFLFGDAPEDWRVIHNEIVDAAKDNPSLRRLAQDSSGFLCRWAYEAHALGWTADRLYGVDPLDQFGESWEPGLLFMLRGGRVIELDEKMARVRYDNGREQLVRVDLATDLQSWAENLPEGCTPIVRYEPCGGAN